MLSVGTGSEPLRAFDGLVNHERSVAFHQGRQALGLETMQALFGALPPCERPRICVHVAGSEGKTSVTERVAVGLGALGLRVGTYTSPHLRDARERLRIDGLLPTQAALRPAVEAVLAAATAAAVTPSWFEALTATAWVLFAQQGLDAAVWETGLGGRLDATRVLPADVCVITSISLEHTAVLGSTEAAIASEKAGILRPGAPLVLGPGVRGEALAVVASEARRLGCPSLRWLGDGIDGDVQRVNVGLAVAVLEQLASLGRLPAPLDSAVRAAVAAHRVAGRHDLLDGVLYDGAHTVSAVERLARRLRAEAAAPGPVLLGVTHGRDAVAMARALRPVARPLLLTRAPGERGIDPAAIAIGLAEQTAPGADARAEVDVARTEAPDVRVVPDPHAALAAARSLVHGDSRIVVTGSLHLIGLLWPDCAPSPGTQPA